MATYITAIPAYGKDYKNQAEAKAAWAAGKDFQDAASRKYLSIRDFANEPKDVHVMIRYSNLRKLVTVR